MRQRVVGSGRPLGPVAIEVLSLLKSSQLAAREVASRLQLAKNVAKYTCSRLESSGHIVVVDRVRVNGSHKRVRIYGVAPPIVERNGSGIWSFAVRLSATA